MPTYKNVSCLGAIDLPLIGRSLEPGEEFEVTAEQAALIKGQTDNFKLVTKKKG